jgi:hypothetical protein
VFITLNRKLLSELRFFQSFAVNRHGTDTHARGPMVGIGDGRRDGDDGRLARAHRFKIGTIDQHGVSFGTSLICGTMYDEKAPLVTLPLANLISSVNAPPKPMIKQPSTWARKLAGF